MLQNLENESNNGLSDVIEFLENLYGETVTVTTTTTHNVKDLLSRADFWQLAANSATELAITRSNRDELSQTNKMNLRSQHSTSSFFKGYLLYSKTDCSFFIIVQQMPCPLIPWFSAGAEQIVITPQALQMCMNSPNPPWTGHQWWIILQTTMEWMKMKWVQKANSLTNARNCLI